jgi:hypothetical protein
VSRSALFRTYHPFKSKLPMTHEELFRDIVYRAKQLLLSDFTRAQVLSFTNATISLIDNSEVRNQGLVQLPGDDDSNNKDISNLLVSDVRILRTCMDKISLEHIYRKKTVQWHHAFALVSLFYVSYASFQENKMKRYEKRKKDAFFWENMHSLSHTQTIFEREAHEALLIAEELRNAKLATKDVIRARAQNAAYKRHEAKDQIKREFIAYYDKYKSNFPSRAEAARRFIVSLPQEKRKQFASTNINRTLLDALRIRLRHKP